MFRQKDSSGFDNIDTLIGPNSVFEGNIECQAAIRVDGKVKGDLKINGDVIIGNNAVITGNVYANNVHLSGTVEGNIHASGVLKLLSSARLYGDIQVQGFVADEGGIFQGKCSMLDQPQPEKSFEKPPKKGHSHKDYKKSTVLDQIYDEREKSND